MILAGGKSSRMGTDKTLLALAGFPTLTHFLHARLRRLFARVVVSAKSPKFDGLEVALDSFAQFAPLPVLARLDEIFDGDVFVICADMPLVRRASILRLFAEFEAQKNRATLARGAGANSNLAGAKKSGLNSNLATSREFFAANHAPKPQICVAKSGGFSHNLCGFYEPRVAAFARELVARGCFKVGALRDFCDFGAVEFDGGAEFLNVNTPSDYELLQRLANDGNIDF